MAWQNDGSGWGDTSEGDTSSGQYGEYGAYGNQPGNTGAGVYPIAPLPSITQTSLGAHQYAPGMAPNPGGGAVPPPGPTAPAPPGFDWNSLMQGLAPDPAWAKQSQQYLDWYTGTEYPQQYALQQQLQGAQIGLADNQNDMQNALATAGLTGQYGGDPTLQAQTLMAQYGLAGSDQSLAARGQDVQMAGIQAQLAQSPLVAWYTARGLAPPQSALMQSLPNFNPYQENWQFSTQGPPVAPLSAGATGQNQAMPAAGTAQDLFNQEITAMRNPTGNNPWNESTFAGILEKGGVTPQAAQAAWSNLAQQNFQPLTWSDDNNWGNFNQALQGGINQSNQSQEYRGAFTNNGSIGGQGQYGGTSGAAGPYQMQGMSNQYSQAPVAADPNASAMSQGAAPWASTLGGGGPALPMFNGNTVMPSTQQWASANPMEQQAMMSVAQSVNGFDPNTFYQQLYAQAPTFGGYSQPAAYSSGGY